ncbi:hypothetical protein HPULCUR_002544 [Helicostylum pulchrum]|uniref:Uncharacterized protein n=1 Tax=Helicostylum pulchrum TaxID=562976 RepID=A0ABP9XS98_9FUNG
MQSDQVEECAGKGNQYPFCSPESDAVWVNGSTHDFIWNKNHPFYVGYPQISLYLYYIVKYEYVSVKNYTDLDTATGGTEVTVDDSWFLDPLENGSPPRNLSISAFYLPSDLSPYAEISSTISMYPRPYNFTVVQLSLPANGTTTPPSSNSNNDNSNSNNNNSNNSSNADHSLSSSTLPGWAIAVIVLAVIAFICGVAALIWAVYMSRRNKTNKLDPITGSNNNNHGYHKEYSTSINSQTKVTAFRSTDSVPMTTASQGENASSIGTLAYDGSNKLTSSDAVFLADSFRNTLGRSVNDWNNTTFVDGEEEEEEKRRKLGEALLQRQLEEDGTSVKHAGRFTRVKSLADIPKSAVFEHPKY